MTSDPWSAYLAALERWTAEQSRKIGLGQLDQLSDDVVRRPDADAVLPAALAGRARAALEELDRLQQELRRSKDDVAADLRSLHRQPPPAGSAQPVYVDSYG